MSNEKKKRRFGDRKDATLVRGLDSMHVIMPHNMPQRTANEAVIIETVDMTAIKNYIDKKNSENPDFKYTFFHVILAAISKTIVLRPYLNRFYSGRKLYQRNDILLSFTAKKQFTDHSQEALAVIKVDQEGINAIEFIHDKIKKFVTTIRTEDKNDGATDVMDILKYLPRFLLTFIFGTLRRLEYFGLYPKALMTVDPYYSTCFATNLGSIKMHAHYHHLADWGTNSLFVIIGEKKMTPFFNDDGTYEMRDALQLGITVDERIADGVYFARSIKLLKHLIANPELLELPIETPVDFEERK